MDHPHYSLTKAHLRLISFVSLCACIQQAHTFSPTGPINQSALSRFNICAVSSWFYIHITYTALGVNKLH